ncbi:MAG: restriction endonuclease subunit S, partial [Promethearchaeota archaeon]
MRKIPTLYSRPSLKKNFHSRYYLYLFEFYGKIGYFESIVNRVSFAHLTREKLKEVLCITPTFEEQKKIAYFLDQKTSEIDLLILNIKNQIEKLKNYRQALISEAVTGKIDVRN